MIVLSICFFCENDKYQIFYSPILVSKENDFDSSTSSSLDTDIEDNSSHGPEIQSATQGVSPSTVNLPRIIHNGAHDGSIIFRHGCGTHDCSHIHMIHSNSVNDPNLNRHNAPLINNTMNSDLQPYYAESIFPAYSDLSSDSGQRVKLPKTMVNSVTPNSLPWLNNYNHSSDINYVYERVPSSNLIRPTVLNSSNSTSFYENHWNARISLPAPTKQEYQSGEVFR